MNLYKPNNKDDEELRVSPDYAFSYMVAILLIICMIVGVLIMTDALGKTGKDSWTGFFVVIPAIFGFFLVPLNFFTGVYYFWKYRDDPLNRKLTVGLALLISVFAFFISQ